MVAARSIADGDGADGGGAAEGSGNARGYRIATRWDYTNHVFLSFFPFFLGGKGLCTGLIGAHAANYTDCNSCPVIVW